MFLLVAEWFLRTLGEPTGSGDKSYRVPIHPHIFDYVYILFGSVTLFPKRRQISLAHVLQNALVGCQNKWTRSQMVVVLLDFV